VSLAGLRICIHYMQIRIRPKHFKKVSDPDPLA
jgi:hypothetical protein